MGVGQASGGSLQRREERHDRDAQELRQRRKIVHIEATDSPNVKLGMAQQAAGMIPTGEQLLAGVKSWDEYCKNLIMFIDVYICPQCINFLVYFF